MLEAHLGFISEGVGGLGSGLGHFWVREVEREKEQRRQEQPGRWQDTDGGPDRVPGGAGWLWAYRCPSRFSIISYMWAAMRSE